MKTELPKGYDPAQVEQKWFKVWEDRGDFHADENSLKPHYSIVIPPPNVTGDLHVGHALTATLEDIMTRWHRMKGEPTLWLPPRKLETAPNQV